MRIAIAMAFVIACNAVTESEPPATPAVRVEDDEAPPKVESKPEPKPVEAPAAAPDDSPLEVGPAAPGGGATTQTREAAVLELLAGSAPAKRFVLVDVEPGKAFVKDLRDTVAPYDGGGALPIVRQQPATVGAGLDRDIVRRIVRSHINEVRHCYNLGLVRNATSSGEIAIGFTIDPEGKVTASSVSRSTLRGSAGKVVSECMAKAVKRWKFPKPSGGASVDVLYPFELTSG